MSLSDEREFSADDGFKCVKCAHEFGTYEEDKPFPAYYKEEAVKEAVKKLKFLMDKNSDYIRL